MSANSIVWALAMAASVCAAAPPTTGWAPIASSAPTQASSQLTRANVEAVLTRVSAAGPITAGQSIKLDLSVRALADGVTFFEGPAAEAGDALSVSPATGVRFWRAEQDVWRPTQQDVVVRRELPIGEVAHYAFELNDWVRFDRPGVYRVTLTTHRSGRAIATNSVRLEVKLPDESTEAAQAQGLAAQLRQRGDARKANAVARQLGWLAGDAATRVKIDLLLHPDEANPCGADLTAGLWIARDRERVISALESAIADPAQVLTVRDDVLPTLIALKLSVETSNDASASRRIELNRTITRTYLHEIALTLPQRTGASRSNAARLILTSRLDGAEDERDVIAARDTMIEHFEDADDYWVGGLLRNEAFAVPAMVPILTRYLDAHGDPGSTLNREAALELLIRLDPSKARHYVAREACLSQPVLLQAVQDLPIATLPEVDNCLRAKFTGGVGPRNMRAFMLGVAMQYAARFASPALVESVEGLLPGLDEGMSQMARGAALTYLLRWKPAPYLPALSATLASRNASFMIPLITSSAYPPDEAMIAFFRAHLVVAESEEANVAAAALARIGEPQDRDRLRILLTQVRQGLHDDASTPVALQELETTLVGAIAHGGRWDASVSDAQAAYRECVSARCKDVYPAR